jgi:hypothetical protein
LVRCEIGAEKNSEADLGMKADYQGEDDRSDDELAFIPGKDDEGAAEDRKRLKLWKGDKVGQSD